jgi:hypothetical protein
MFPDRLRKANTAALNVGVVKVAFITDTVDGVIVKVIPTKAWESKETVLIPEGKLDCTEAYSETVMLASPSTTIFKVAISEMVTEFSVFPLTLNGCPKVALKEAAEHYKL